MSTCSDLYAGDATKIGEAFASTGSARGAPFVLAHAELPGIVPDETGELPNSTEVMTLLACAVAGRQPLEFSGAIAERLVGDPDPEEATNGAYVMSESWTELFAGLTKEQARTLAGRWLEEWDPGADDAPEHVAGLVVLLEGIMQVCRTARERAAAVVFTWAI